MGQWAKCSGLNVALVCLVVYSLRSVSAQGPTGGGRRRSTTTTAPPSSSTSSGFTLPPTGSSSTGEDNPSPIWRRRQPMIHRRQFTTTTPPSNPLLSQLPDDFINLASNSAPDFTGSASEPLPFTSSFYPTTGTGAQKIVADPFMLSGNDNVLGPTVGPTGRRKVFRRTRRRRIKKLRAGSSSDTAVSSTTEEDDYSGSTTAASTENGVKFHQSLFTTTVRSTTARPSNATSTVKLEVVPIDSLNGHTDEVSTEGVGPSPLFLPTTGPTAPHLKPGYYTPKNGPRKRAKSKENLWKASSGAPGFSVELFDDTDATEELPNSNLGKRENRNNKTEVSFPLPKPTALSSYPSDGDMSTGESIQNSYVNTSLPISTELQNSLQFTLQVLHPLLNSDTVLTQGEGKLPENKTVAITHSLAESPADTPIDADLRFLPAHLRKSHPLLSQETFFDGGGVLGGKKVGNNRFQGMHSIRNRPTTTSTTQKTTMPVVTPSSTTTTTTRQTTTTKLTTTSTEPSSTSTTSTTTAKTSTSAVPTSTFKAYPTAPNLPGNVHLEQLGNLKITEIIYPTNGSPPPKDTSPINNMRGYVAPPSRGTSTSTSTAASITTGSTSTRKTTLTFSSSTPLSTSSGRPSPIFDQVDKQKTPPLILMGSESIGSAIESPPAFDDLLLEELIKGFEPPKPSTTTTTTTTTPRPTTRTTTTTTTTTPPPAVVTPDEETQQLLQLLNLLQANNAPISTTTTGKSTTTTGSTSTLNPTAGGGDDFLKNLALLENLLSPTAKTMIKDAVDTGTTAKIKNSAAQQPPLTNSDLHQIFQLLDTMSSTTSTTTTTTTTTTPKPPPQVLHPALQNVLNMLTNPTQQSPAFSLPQPPKPVPTSSSFDLLSQLFNLNGGAGATVTQKPVVAPAAAGTFGSALSGLFDSFLPKKTPTHRDTAASNPLLSFFQTPSEPVVQTPAPGPYYWFDVNAFLGQDPNAGPMSGIRPKFGNRDYFLKVRRRRNSMEVY